MANIARIEMVITLTDGEKVKVSMDASSVMRWGNDTPTIGATVEATASMYEAARSCGAFPED